MPEIEVLGDGIGVVLGGSNIGVVRGDGGEVALIDTGIGEDSAKAALRAVREAGWGEVTTVLTTHGHADHFGGNATVVKRTGARVLAPPFDAAILRDPELLPALVFGGAQPIEALNTRFLRGKPSPIDGLLEPGPLTVAGRTVEIVALPGHSPRQVGVVVEDIFFCADVVLPERVLAKYGIPYAYSITDHYASLDRARGTEATTIIPGHGEPLDPAAFDHLIDINWQALDTVIEEIMGALALPASTDELTGTVLHGLGIDPPDPATYYLLRATMAAFLSHLEGLGEIYLEIQDGLASWRRNG